MLLSPFDDHIQQVLSYWGQFEAELARMSVFVWIVAPTSNKNGFGLLSAVSLHFDTFFVPLEVYAESP